MCVCAQLLSCVWLLVTPWTVAHQAPLSMGFSGQEYWSRLPFSSSRGSCWTRDGTIISCGSCIAGGFFTHWDTRETLASHILALSHFPLLGHFAIRLLALQGQSLHFIHFHIFGILLMMWPNWVLNKYLLKKIRLVKHCKCFSER